MKKLSKLMILGLVVAMCGPGAARAIPVQFDFDAVVVTISGTISGVSVGDAVSITVFGDNGGSDLMSETWNNADISSAVLTSGTYTATYFPPSSYGDPMFTTNASGVVNFSREIFCCLGNGSFDSLGGTGTPTHSRNAFSTSAGGSAFWDLDSGGFNDTWDASDWTISNASVPESASLALLSLGLIGLGMNRLHQRLL